MNNPDLTKLATEYLSVLLKDNGFKKKGSSYLRSVNDVVQIVNFQKSTSSSADHLKAAINLGVYSKVLAELLEDPIDESSVWNCHWNARLGEWIPGFGDKWWVICSEQEASQASHEITELMRSHGLSKLKELSSTSNLVALWRSGVGSGLTRGAREKYVDLLSPLFQ